MTLDRGMVTEWDNDRGRGDCSEIEAERDEWRARAKRAEEAWQRLAEYAWAERDVHNLPMDFKLVDYDRARDAARSAFRALTDADFNGPDGVGGQR